MSSFPEQVQFSLAALCRVYSSCIQRYALQCSDDGHFAQLIFGADLARAYRSRSSEQNCPAAIIELLSKHFLAFEEQLGTHVKTLAFFIRDLLMDRTLVQMKTTEQRLFLGDIYQKLNVLQYTSAKKFMETKEDLPIEQLTDLILNTLPRDIFDRQGTYYDLLIRLVKRMFSSVYLFNNQRICLFQRTFITSMII